MNLPEQVFFFLKLLGIKVVSKILNQIAISKKLINVQILHIRTFPVSQSMSKPRRKHQQVKRILRSSCANNLRWRNIIVCDNNRALRKEDRILGFPIAVFNCNGIEHDQINVLT